MSVVVPGLDNIKLLIMVGKLYKKRPMLEFAFSQQLCCKFRATGTKSCGDWQRDNGGSKGRCAFTLRVKKSSILELLHHDAEGRNVGKYLAVHTAQYTVDFNRCPYFKSRILLRVYWKSLCKSSTKKWILH